MRGANGYVVLDTLIFDDPNAGINFDTFAGEEWLLIGANGYRRHSTAPQTAPDDGESIGSIPGPDVFPATVYVVKRSTFPLT